MLKISEDKERRHRHNIWFSFACSPHHHCIGISSRYRCRYYKVSLKERSNKLITRIPQYTSSESRIHFCIGREIVLITHFSFFFNIHATREEHGLRFLFVTSILKQNRGHMCTTTVRNIVIRRASTLACQERPDFVFCHLSAF